jgi:hypothetical protein
VRAQAFSIWPAPPWPPSAPPANHNQGAASISLPAAPPISRPLYAREPHFPILNLDFHNSAEKFPTLSYGWFVETKEDPTILRPTRYRHAKKIVSASRV